MTFDIEIRGIDGTGTPIANEYLRFDTDANPVGGTNLSTSYQTLYSSQSPVDEGQYQFWVFCWVPFGIPDKQTFTFTLKIRIVET